MHMRSSSLCKVIQIELNVVLSLVSTRSTCIYIKSFRCGGSHIVPQRVCSSRECCICSAYIFTDFYITAGVRTMCGPVGRQTTGNNIVTLQTSSTVRWVFFFENKEHCFSLDHFLSFSFNNLQHWWSLVLLLLAIYNVFQCRFASCGNAANNSCIPM